MKIIKAYCLFAALFLLYQIGYYVGYYDYTTSEIVHKRVFAQVVEEILAYQGPFAKLTVIGDNATLSNMLIIAKNVDCAVDIRGDTVTFKDSNLQLRDFKYGIKAGPSKK